MATVDIAEAAPLTFVDFVIYGICIVAAAHGLAFVYWLYHIFFVAEKPRVKVNYD